MNRKQRRRTRLIVFSIQKKKAQQNHYQVHNYFSSVLHGSHHSDCHSKIKAEWSETVDIWNQKEFRAAEAHSASVTTLRHLTENLKNFSDFIKALDWKKN